MKSHLVQNLSSSGSAHHITRKEYAGSEPKKSADSGGGIQKKNIDKKSLTQIDIDGERKSKRSSTLLAKGSFP